MKKINIDSNEMNPMIRRVGIQDNCGWSYMRKLYDYEMLYFLDGKGKVEVDGQKFNLSKGSIILLPPDTPSKFYLSIENSYVIWVHFDFVYFSEWNDIDYYDNQLKQKHLIRPQVFLNNGWAFPYHIMAGDREVMDIHFEQLLGCYKEHAPFWQIRCKSILLEILYQIIHQVYKEDTHSFYVSKEQMVHEMCQYISHYYQHKLTLDEIANYIGISVNYANKIFKKNTGETLIQYLNNYRLQKAIHMIESSDLTIEQIAEYVGFSNSYYFSRMMKKYTGKSPREYRQK